MTNKPQEEITKSAESERIDSPVYFLSIEVENVLCFKDRQRLDLSDGNGNPAKWTVILGNNGVGKTTLLRCLGGMEHKESAILQGNFYPLIFEPFEGLYMWTQLKSLKDNYSIINAKFLIKAGLRNVPHEDANSDTKNQAQEIYLKLSLQRRSAEMQSNNISEKRLKDLTCYGYGATRRMEHTSLNESFSNNNSESLFSDNATLINAEEWLLQTDYAVKSALGATRDRLERQLNQIKEILKRILPEIDDIRITPVDEERDRPTVEFSTPYGWVGLFSLGLGYRTMIAWMVDLAVRLFKRYPQSEDPLAEPAIVLIDEIDLHLHPKWQRTIMEFLTDRFPNTQFIVTAHSPLVVQAAQDANIVLLRREGDHVVIDNDPEIIDNWRVDQVLTSIFEIPSVRPVKIEPWLNRRREILSQPHLSESDRIELKGLEGKIGSLPTAETPEDIKAMDIIRRAAKLLEKSGTEE